jgi:hypothetical protein
VTGGYPVPTAPTRGGARDIDPALQRRSEHLVAKEVLPALQAG